MTTFGEPTARAVTLALQRAVLELAATPPGFAVRYVPAAGSNAARGDWHEVIELGSDQVGLVVGGGAGRGPGAAAAMTRLRGACRASLLQAQSPARTLEALDEIARGIPHAVCARVFAAVVDQVTGEVRYSAAGHAAAMIVHADRSLELLDRAAGDPLARPGETSRPEAVTRVQLGSVLALVNADPPDEVALLVYRHSNPTPFSAALAVDPTQLAPMRWALRRWLEESGAPAADVDAVLIAVGETCSNALEQGSTAELRGTIVAGRLELLISHGGDRHAPQGPAQDQGRRLLERLMDSTSIESGPGGTLVRLRKDLGRRP